MGGDSWLALAANSFNKTLRTKKTEDRTEETETENRGQRTETETETGTETEISRIRGLNKRASQPCAPKGAGG